MPERKTKIHDCADHADTDGISNTGDGNGIICDAVTDGPEVRDGEEYREGTDRGQTPQQKSDRVIRPLNDFMELTIGGVTYRVQSVFADKGQMGELLDLAAMEKINRIA